MQWPISLLAAVACSPKLAQGQLEKVQEGMTTEQVKALLGTPTEVSTTSVPLLGTVTTYSYKSEKGEVTVVFHDDKLATKVGSVSK